MMQLLLSTAADKNVGISDISTVENNIHAGTKYMAFLREHYFSDPQIHPAAKMDFAWASYNAGPTGFAVFEKRRKSAALTQTDGLAMLRCSRQRK